MNDIETNSDRDIAMRREFFAALANMGVNPETICKNCGRPWSDHYRAWERGKLEEQLKQAEAELRALDAAGLVEFEHIAEAFGRASGTGTFTTRNINTDALPPKMTTQGMIPTRFARLRSLGMAIEDAAYSAENTEALASHDPETALQIADHLLTYLDKTDQVIVTGIALDRLVAWAEFGVAAAVRSFDKSKVSRKWIENNQPAIDTPGAADKRSAYDKEL